MQTEQKIKLKKEFLGKTAWMNQRPNPLPIFKQNQNVLVYRNQSWTKGRVVSSSPSGCVVNLDQDSTIFRVYDARCIRSLDE